MKKARYHFNSVILAGVLIFSTLLSHAGEKVLPFSIGEHIQYTVRWEMIKAGEANFQVHDTTTVNGEKAYHFTLEVKSYSYVDMFYKIRDRHESFTDDAFCQSLLYKKTQSGKDKKQAEVQFDWVANTATYSNFGEKRDPIEVPLKTFDPLSSFYKMRTLDFKTDSNLSFSVTDGKKKFIQKGDVIKKEKITVPSGTFDTYVISPQVNHFSGVFKKSEDPSVKVWITADDKKIPVKIKVKVFIGSIIFDLVSVK
ncbi:MAG: DUF3108 domain-containing protein [Desulfobacteraceae bacterium]|nr:DUF3108 domain-containing protein [Desulfobacteraceae bacterium]